jgi:hypothetical protein
MHFATVNYGRKTSFLSCSAEMPGCLAMHKVMHGETPQDVGETTESRGERQVAAVYFTN